MERSCVGEGAKGKDPQGGFGLVTTETRPRFPRKRVNINANFHFKRCLPYTQRVRWYSVVRGKNLGPCSASTNWKIQPTCSPTRESKMKRSPGNLMKFCYSLGFSLTLTFANPGHASKKQRRTSTIATTVYYIYICWKLHVEGWISSVSMRLCTKPWTCPVEKVRAGERLGEMMRGDMFKRSPK